MRAIFEAITEDGFWIFLLVAAFAVLWFHRPKKRNLWPERVRSKA